MMKCLLPMMSAALLFCLSSSAAPTEIDYQGRITISRQPFSGTAFFKFTITDAAESTNVWANDGSAAGEPAAGCPLPLSEGRFSTLLGGAPMHPIDSSALSSAGTAYLRVWFSTNNVTFSELTPKQKLASAPYSINALKLEGKGREFFQNADHLTAGTVPDERLGTDVSRLGSSIGPAEIESGAVGSAAIADGSIRADDLALGEIDARYVRADAPAAALHVNGSARFDRGIAFVAPLGDLSMGIYTNRP